MIKGISFLLHLIKLLFHVFEVFLQKKKLDFCLTNMFNINTIF